ncbi:hypothetical protein JL720_10578 [Aureococcus anophagefferens]|nr:hypothetical protein JL720_10578 [Aureococcus anophagefferens]
MLSCFLVVAPVAAMRLQAVAALRWTRLLRFLEIAARTPRKASALLRRSVVAEALRDGRRARLLRSNNLVNAAVVGFMFAAAVGALSLDRADAAYGAGATSCDDLEAAATGLRAATHALAAAGLAAAALPILGARGGIVGALKADAAGTLALFAKFLAQQYCLENLVFWRLVAALPPGDAVGFGDADRIFGEFLDPRTATLQVNVPAEPIAACARECRHLMETDSLPRFKKWGPYVAFLDDGVARAAGPGIGDEWAELLAVYDGEPAAFATENPLQEAASTRPSDASKRLGEQRRAVPAHAARAAATASRRRRRAAVEHARAAPAKVEPPRRTSRRILRRQADVTWVWCHVLRST